MSDWDIEEEALSPEQAKLQNAQMAAWLLPDEPTEKSLFEAREIIKVYAHAGIAMPAKLLNHLDQILAAKPNRTVTKRIADGIKSTRVADVRTLEVISGMKRIEACTMLDERDGMTGDVKTFTDNCSRKKFAMTDAEVIENIEIDMQVYGVNDPNDLMEIILADKP